MARNVVIESLPNMDEARKRVGKVETIAFSYKPSKELIEHFTGKKIFIRTYGCQANIRDEETLLGLFSLLGMTRTENPEEATIAILNTCAVRENAEDKVFGEIGQFKALKVNNKDLILMLCGCMVEQKHIIEEVLNKYPQVDIFFGTHNLEDAPELVEKYLFDKKKSRIVNVLSKEGSIVEKLPVTRIDDYKAFVNITYGCDKFCTYCIVPYTRGKERSRNINDILDECRTLVSEGYKEITLLGQNVDSYGKDLDDGITFAKLLEEVAKLGIPRLRFLTSYPSDFSDEVIDVIARYDNIMKYIHLPIQSGNDEVLKRMGRRYTREDYLKLFDKMKVTIPNVAISTDIIVGFPGESDKDFQDTLDVVNYCKFDNAFTFIFSPRIGTPAAKMEDNTSLKVKEERLAKLNELVNKYSLEHNKELLNKEVLVLIEGISAKDSTKLYGYTDTMKLVNVEGSKDLIGKIVKVLITDAKSFSLDGKVIQNK